MAESWLKNYHKASFRGVRFYVATADNEYGRRGAHHEFPQRDKGYFEDLGDKDPQYSFDAYVTEQLSDGEYTEQRDNLIKACRSKGFGELVHPYLGTRRVACTECRVRESVEEGGIARFTLTFLEATTKKPAASDSEDTAASLTSSAKSSLAKTLSNLVKRLGSLSSAASWVKDAVSGNLSLTTATCSGLLGSLAGYVGSDFTSWITSARTLCSYGTDLIDTVQSLSDFDAKAYGISELAKLSAKTASGQAIASDDEIESAGSVIQGVLTLFPAAAGNAATAYRAYRELWDFGLDWTEPPQTTPSRVIQAECQASVASFVRETALALACAVVTELDFASRDEAQAVQGELCEHLESEMFRTDSDEAYLLFDALRAALVRHLTATAPTLPRVREYLPGRTLPAVVLSYELYASPLYDADLISRNKLRQPGFVPAGQPLEALISG